MRKIRQTFLALLIGIIGSVFCATTTLAQQISGTVTDAETENPIPGVNIYIPELETGSATATDGSYEITLDEAGTYTVVATYVGYERFETTLQVADGESIELNIELTQSGIIGEDVVVVGYGTQEREDVTGSVSSVSAEEMNEVSITSIDQGLQGRTAGVTVTQSGTKPGSGAEVRIRGNRSINAGNDPLYVVDGVPLSGGLRDINPSTIQSIEVLKDASATATYGVRGSNGVVIVTTSRGYDGD
jgi:TonB-dependent SusC/RagA subfamily outer membrane receptor